MHSVRAPMLWVVSTVVIIIYIFLSPPVACAQDTSEEELPDDYLPFTLRLFDDKLEGESQFLEGFRITLDVSRDDFGSELNVDSIYALVRDGKLSGTLTYPNGKVTDIEFEIVNHRGTDEIYMKSSLGFFPWEYISVQDDELSFAVYWWYCPPAEIVDLEIIEMAESLLADSTRWHKNDDRDCEDDIENDRWSLFCALKHASITKTGEYNHHNTAMQTTRFVIDDLVPNHGYAHTLMDFNNAPSTSHSDILHVLELAKKRITKELSESSTQ